jgi:hypothetical protein
MSPQATLVSQQASAVQRANSKGMNVTVQRCDLSRVDQRFAPAPDGRIASVGSTSALCLDIVNGAPLGVAGFSVLARPCEATPNGNLTLQQDEELTIVRVASMPGQCVTETKLQPQGYVPVEMKRHAFQSKSRDCPCLCLQFQWGTNDSFGSRD